MGLFGPSIPKLVRKQDLDGLLKLLESEDSAVSNAAAAGVVELSLSAANEEIRRQAFEEICALPLPGRTGVWALLVALRSITTQTKDEPYLTRVRATLEMVLEHSPDMQHRWAAAQALVQFGDAAVESLCRGMLRASALSQLRDWPFTGAYVWDERTHMAATLAETHDPRVVAPILAAVDFQEQSSAALMPRLIKMKFSEAAREALGKLSPAAVDELIGMLKVGSKEQLKCVVPALAAIGGEQAMTALTALESDAEEWKRELATEALAKSSGQLAPT